MPKQKYMTGVIVLLIVIFGFAFYWYSYRPEQIRKQCYQIALKGTFDKDYKSCLLSNGLED